MMLADVQITEADLEEVDQAAHLAAYEGYVDAAAKLTDLARRMREALEARKTENHG